MNRTVFLYYFRLGEVCSHVAALLFKVEIAVKMGLTRTSSTSDACKWNASFRKQLEPLTLQEMHERGLVRGNRKKSVTSVNPTGRASLPAADVLNSLHDICPNAAFFTSIPGFKSEETDSDDDHTDYPPLMISFFDDENINLSDQEIHEKVNFILTNLQCSQEQCNNLEEGTRNQAVSQLWYNHRKGRVTGTKAHDVLVRRQTTNPDNLVKRIVGYNTFDISSKPAVKYGTDNEAKARDIYSAQQGHQHQNFTCRQSGFMVDSRNPFIGASADGVIGCDCCGGGVLEIKCPFTHKNQTAHEAANTDNSFCLKPDLTLKTSHRYYTQIQLQMYVNQVKYCDFVVFTQPGEPCLHINRIPYNAAFCKQLVDLCSSHWKAFVLPELVSGRLDNQMRNVPEDEPTIPVWCICGQPEYGKMIQCDNTDCKMEWFHYPCVNVKRKPVRKWVCPSCRD